MKRASSVLVGIVIFLTLVSLWGPAGQALTLGSSRDCDSNAVIRCGALNFTELQNRSTQTGATEIYASFGISAQDINNMPNTAVEGIVTNKNNVWIHRSSGLCPVIDQNSLNSQTQQAVLDNPNLCLVATNAMTAGRQNISGSTSMTSSGVTFFMRPPSVSFVSSSLPAFVSMDNGQFDFAIIASCGNPVMATPVTPAKKLTPPVTVTPTRPTQALTQTQTQTQTVVVNTPPAVQAATTTVSQPAAAAKTLPNTGPGGIMALAGTTSILGTLGHYIFSRRRLI
jgi:hypothetical protein